jgi:hypothetical protein
LPAKNGSGRRRRGRDVSELTELSKGLVEGGGPLGAEATVGGDSAVGLELLDGSRGLGAVRAVAVAWIVAVSWRAVCTWTVIYDASSFSAACVPSQ